MKDIQISRDVVPLGEFKAQAARILGELADEHRPLVITQNGRPAGVLLSPVAFDEMRERQRFLESVAAGLADAEAGRTMNTEELEARLAARRERRG